MMEKLEFWLCNLFKIDNDIQQQQKANNKLLYKTSYYIVAIQLELLKYSRTIIKNQFFSMLIITASGAKNICNVTLKTFFICRLI